MLVCCVQATNRRTLGAMVKELGKGGKLVWIAPSGGRDRPDPHTGDWLPHKYDAGNVDSSACGSKDEMYCSTQTLPSHPWSEYMYLTAQQRCQVRQAFPITIDSN